MTVDGVLDDTVHEALRGVAGLHHVTVLPGAPDAADWIGYLDAVHPGRIAHLLAAAGAYCGGCPTRTARTAAETLLLGDIAAALAAPIGAVLAAQRRGLVLDPADVRLHLNADGADAVAVGAPQLWVTAGDPLAGHPATRTAPTMADLRHIVATGYAQLLQPMLSAAQPIVRRGRRALWAEATERLTYAVFAPLHRLGRAHRAPAEVADLLAVAPPELRHPVRWLEIPLPAGPLRWKARNLCCLAYQTPRWRGEYCTTCPATPPAEAVRRLRSVLTADEG